MSNELPYDGDLDDPSQRCKHGTFIGSHWGPDYLCPACECPHDDFDEDGVCTRGCGYLQDGTPEPGVGLCYHSDTYQDFDGSWADAPCHNEARHTVLIHQEQFGNETVLLCSTHLSEMLCADTVVERDGEVWLDNDTRLLALLVGEVRP